MNKIVNTKNIITSIWQRNCVPSSLISSKPSYAATCTQSFQWTKKELRDTPSSPLNFSRTSIGENIFSELDAAKAALNTFRSRWDRLPIPVACSIRSKRDASTQIRAKLACRPIRSHSKEFIPLGQCISAGQINQLSQSSRVILSMQPQPFYQATITLEIARNDKKLIARRAA